MDAKSLLYKLIQRPWRGWLLRPGLHLRWTISASFLPLFPLSSPNLMSLLLDARGWEGEG